MRPDIANVSKVVVTCFVRHDHEKLPEDRSLIISSSKSFHLGGCRVYLMGGASASGTSKDTVVVYTPALLDEGIYIANLTIPEGLFWSDIINPPGGHASHAY